MKYNYDLLIQFANPNAPDFNNAILSEVEAAITEYNTKSRLAKNPKQIVSSALLDSRTLKLTLQSEAELPFPGKALRLFSASLVEPLGEWIYGKQLFKMQVVEKDEPPVALEGTEALKLKAISLILAADDEKIQEVIAILEDRND